MEEILNTNFPECEAKSHSLNHSGSKKLTVILQSIYPTVKLVLELNATEHKESIFFSFKTWRILTQHAADIRTAVKDQEEKIFFTNDELKVFTQYMYEDYAICFLDIRGKRVNIMLKTFSNMMRLENKIIEDYNKKIQMIRTTAKKLKDFANFLLVQYSGVQRCNEIRGYLEMLNNYSEPYIGESRSDLSYMYDTEVESEDVEYDDSDYCYHCGRFNKSSWS